MTPHVTMELLDYVAELTRTHQHREPYTVRLGRTGTSVTQHHVTQVPPLLQQLQFASPSGRGEERGGGGYESRPAAAVASIDALIDIDTGAAKWIRDLGEDDPANTMDCVSMLAGLAANLVRCKKPSRRCCEYHELERDIRHWWVVARVVTGWDSPAWRPDNTCPMCGVRDTLRIKLVEQVGFCAECRESWDQATIGLLAEHIRQESAGERTAPQAVFCWCPFPRPAVDAWPSLCPDCASPWCHRAGWTQTLEGPGDTPEHAWVS